MNSLAQDIRYALRMLRKTPALTAAALTCLVLGIGANTAIFSVVNTVLLRPLPFAQPERLVVLMEEDDHGVNFTFSPADYLDIRDQSQALQEIAGYRRLSVVWNQDDGPVSVDVQSVTYRFFQTFGIRPLAGRWFESGDEDAKSVVVSERFWRRELGADESCLGRTLTFNDEAHTIVGVAPASFGFPDQSELWVRSYRDGVPEPPIDLGQDLAPIRSVGYFGAVGRLADGVDLQQAAAELHLLGERLATVEGADSEEPATGLIPLSTHLLGELQPSLFTLLAAVALVLLIACCNVANLLLARSAARSQEMAVRTALGASRGRLIRQMLIESVTLAVVGGLGGLLLATWGIGFLIRLAPAEVPRLAEVSVNGTVLAFTLAVAVTTGLVFGLVPAFQTSRSGPRQTLVDGGRAVSGSRGPYRGLLVIGEVALSLVLLCAAGLLITSLYNLSHVNPGFESQGILAAELRLPPSRFSEEQQTRIFHDRLTSDIAAIPGVSSSGVALFAPFGTGGATLGVHLEGRPAPDGESWVSRYQAASPGYFPTLGVPVVSGRSLTESDRQDTAHVAVVNESFARRFFPDINPVGRRIAFSTSEEDLMEIVGVVGNIRQVGFDQPSEPEVFVPLSQDPGWPFLSIVLRSDGDPMSLVGDLRQAIHAIDPQLPLLKVRPLSEVVEGSLLQRRFTVQLLGLFAITALLLTAIGIYGVLMSAANQRIREFGIRMALGAEAADVVRLTLSTGLRWVAIGVGLGLLGSLTATRLLASQLFAIEAIDPRVFSLAVFALLGAAVLACVIPACRTARLAPVDALRSD